MIAETLVYLALVGETAHPIDILSPDISDESSPYSTFAAGRQTATEFDDRKDESLYIYPRGAFTTWEHDL